MKINCQIDHLRYNNNIYTCALIIFLDSYLNMAAPGDLISTVSEAIERVRSAEAHVCANRARIRRLGDRLARLLPILPFMDGLRPFLLFVQVIEDYVLRFCDQSYAIECLHSEVDVFADTNDQLRCIFEHSEIEVDYYQEHDENMADRSADMEEIERLLHESAHGQHLEQLRSLQRAQQELQNLRQQILDIILQDDEVPAVSEGRLQRREVLTVLNDRVRDIEELGEGSFGRVHSATLDDLGHVAVKRIKKVYRDEVDAVKLTKQVKREAVILSLLSCEHVVKLHAVVVDTAQQAIGLVLEPFSCSLFQVLHSRSRSSCRQLLFQSTELSLQTKLHIALQTVRGLHYLHSLDIVHRDIKPGNILLRPLDSALGWKVAISDFGLSKLLSSKEVLGSAAATTTALGQIKGTYPYLAPEIVLVEAVDVPPSSLAADVYALAVVLNELFVEAAPYPGLDSAKIFSEMQRQEGLLRPTLFSADTMGMDVEKGLQRLVQMGWHVDPKRRLSAQTMGTRLQLIACLTNQETPESFIAEEVNDTPQSDIANNDVNPFSVESSSLDLFNSFAVKSTQNLLTLGPPTTGTQAPASRSLLASQLAADPGLPAPPAVAESTSSLRIVPKERLRGHTDTVRCLCACPNNLLVSGSNDKTIRIWNLATYSCTTILYGHTRGVNCVAALPFGRIISGSDDRTLWVWNLYTGATEKVLTGHDEDVLCVAVLPEIENRVISGSADTHLIVWSMTTGTALYRLEGNSGSVYCLAVLPQERVVSGDGMGMITVWDLPSESNLQMFSAHHNAVTCLAVLSADRIASGSTDCSVRIWDISSGTLLHKMSEHEDFVWCLCVLTDERLVSAGGKWSKPKGGDAKLYVWNTETGSAVQVVEGHAEYVHCLVSLTDGRLVSGSGDDTILLWNKMAINMSYYRI